MIIACNQGGLANRLKAIASVLRSENDEIRVFWPVIDSYDTSNFLLNCPYDILFTYPQETLEISKGDKKYNNHCLLIKKDDPIPVGWSKFKSKCAKKFSASSKEGRNIDFEYLRIPKSLRDEYVNQFRKIKLKADLVKVIDHFAMKNFNSSTISVHIRSWNRPNEKGRQTLYDIRKFKEVMKPLVEKGHNFFISSDNSETIETFTKIFGSKIIFFPRDTVLINSRNHPEGIKEDLIDLYLLSKNNYIIGSHLSTFTEVAWYLAGCPKITIL